MSFRNAGGVVAVEHVRHPRLGMEQHHPLENQDLVAPHRESSSSSSLPNKAPSCIVTLHGMILDVTRWAAQHPGGAAVLQRYHGRDATQAFEAAGHSDAARSLLVGLAAADDNNDDDDDDTNEESRELRRKPLVSQPTTLILLVSVLAWLRGAQRHTDLPPTPSSPLAPASPLACHHHHHHAWEASAPKDCTSWMTGATSPPSPAEISVGGPNMQQELTTMAWTTSEHKQKEEWLN